MQIGAHFIKFFARLTWYIIAFVMLLALGFHLWFINHSEKAIEDLVTWRSGGKLKVIIKKFKIDYINNRITIKDLTIVNTDSAQESTAYRFNTQDFHVRIRSLWDLVFYKQLLVDSVVFNKPEFIVTRKDVRQHDTTKSQLQLTDELGNIYKAINQSLNVLNLQRFEINSGRIIIKDAGNTGRPPFSISNVFFSIDKLNVDSNSVKNFSALSLPERVFLHIDNQKILLQDTNSSIAFKNLVIDSKEKLIRITKPRINLAPQKNEKGSFAFAADILNISGLDFNALYLQQLIKADSIYIQNPEANLEIFSDQKNKNINRKSKLEDFNVLKQLPVAVNINHIVIQHSDGTIRLHKADKTTSFQTKNDNLSIVGLRLNDTTKNILSIDGFNYTLRNYIGYTHDSIYSFRFDSLQFINNKIVLHNFRVATIKQTQTGLIRTYTAPRFEITGLDWFSFIFSNHFKAKSAVLYGPVLNLVKNNLPQNQNEEQKTNKKSIYQLLSVLDNIMDLDELKIVNAKLNMNQVNNLEVQLQNLNLDINIKELTAAKSFDQIVHSVVQLSFDTAIATSPTAVLLIKKANFDSKGKSLLLSNVLLNNANINASLNGVALNDFYFDDNGLEVNGVHWGNGNINITADNNDESKTSVEKKTPALLINNISGNNTTLHFENKNIIAEISLKTIAAASLNKPVGQPFELNGLALAGDSASVDLPDSKIQFDDFLIADNAKSNIQHISFKEKNNSSSIFLTAPSFNFIPLINETFKTKTISADSVTLVRPAIFISAQKTASNEQPPSINLPVMHIKNFAMIDASVHYKYVETHGKIETSCEKLSLNVGDFSARKNQGLLLNDTKLQVNNISFKKDEQVFFKCEGGLNAEAKEFLYQPETAAWKMQLDKIAMDSINYAIVKSGDKNSRLNIRGANAKNIIVTDADMKRLLPWFINQSNADIMLGNIYWQSGNTNLQMNHIEFNQPEKQISINSFSIDPRKNREDFINQLQYREDYIQGISGGINIKGVELNDGFLHMPYVIITNPVLNIYSDKLKQPGIETTQPLPVNALMKSPVDLKMGIVQVNNMAVHYTELNADTKRTGYVFFTNINGTIKNISSKPVQDSLSVNVHAKFLDTIPLHLSMKESYTDPLSGLELQLQLGHGNIRLLNPFLSSLTSMDIRSGYVDTMSMAAFGNQYAAHGNMRLYYHHLNAGFLDSGNVQHQKPVTKLLNFFANALAIRNNNDSHQAAFKFIRNKDKSVISYFLEMIVQGAAKSVAPVSGILYKKEYKKAVKNSGKQNMQ